MATINEKVYLDKLRACWIGKNIGGTIGAPYEGRRQLLSVTDFSKDFDTGPLPNDDLDLQLVWLRALEERGVKNFHANTLAEYWTDWIAPNWNEYGIAKTNLRAGLLPPMSGEVDNEKWKTSNGAWIRSELWAGLFPGATDLAARYAIYDACVDHGISDGTAAEVFTATLQSAAYFENDISVLLEKALSKIPENSAVAKTVREVIRCHSEGVPYETARERVVEMNAELGWFQAAGNIGFMVIGLLYGEGDFKKSVLCALNCGDDTDCTAATVGATLGILYGTKGIPEDWKRFVGDKIVTVSINGQYQWFIPKTCTNLAERIHALVPALMRENGVPFAFTDGESDTSGLPDTSGIPTFFSRSPYSFEITRYPALGVTVELDCEPRICEGEKKNITLILKAPAGVEETKKLNLRLLLPDGWTGELPRKTVTLPYPQYVHGVMGEEKVSLTVTAGDKISPINRVYVEITSPTVCYPVLVPIVFLG